MRISGYSASGRARLATLRSSFCRTRAFPPSARGVTKPAPGYDQLPAALVAVCAAVGLGDVVHLCRRRVKCPEHGVVVEQVPWSDGKRPVTLAMRCFLSRWARRLSWRETARVFGTSWECVYRSVEWVCGMGSGAPELVNVYALGVDEIHWGRSQRPDNF